jgi:hypothetical protein
LEKNGVNGLVPSRSFVATESDLLLPYTDTNIAKMASISNLKTTIHLIKNKINFFVLFFIK